VSCTRGAVFDAAVDLRTGSKSRGKWVGVELSADNRCTLYIPAGFAHGFQTLTDDAEGYATTFPNAIVPRPRAGYVGMTRISPSRGPTPNNA
jgi:dTDP-4-dehydrorhamnose 3,5-epimerase-like enzyme